MYGIQHIKEVIVNGEVISSLSDEKILAQLSVYLKYIYNDLGQVPHADDVAYLKSQLLPLLRNKFGTLRIAEVGLAFRNGVQKKYGEYFGVNFVSLSMFLEAYTSSQDRCDAVIQVRAIENAGRLLGGHVAEFDGEARVAEMRAHFEEFGTCDDTFNLAYNYLDAKGELNFSIEDKHRLYYEAQKSIADKLELEKKLSKNYFQFQELEKKFLAIHEEKRSPAVIVEAKKLALIEHFKKTINT